MEPAHARLIPGLYFLTRGRTGRQRPPAAACRAVPVCVFCVFCVVCFVFFVNEGAHRGVRLPAYELTYVRRLMKRRLNSSATKMISAL